MRVLHLNKSGNGLASKTACGRDAVNTPMSANWTEYKAATGARCARCEASKQAELNRKRDAEQAAPVVHAEEVETIIAQPVADGWEPEADADAWKARDAALIAAAKDRGAALSLVKRIAPQPVCVPGQPLPASFIVFTSWERLTAVHPTVADLYELRRVSDGPAFAGAIYPVRVIAPDNVWIGEPCATQADAERAALAHLRMPVALNRYWITAANERGQVTVNQLYDAATEGEAREWAFNNVAREHRGSICVTLHSVQPARPVTVSLEKPEAPECVCILADVPQESNADVMARAVAFVRDIRLTREYVAACAGDTIMSAVLAIAPPEVVTAMAHADEDARLAAEYLAAKEGDAATLDAGETDMSLARAIVALDDGEFDNPALVARGALSVDPYADIVAWSRASVEQERALAHEQARADAARKLCDMGKGR